MLHEVSQDSLLKHLPVDVSLGGHRALPLASDAILENVGNLLSSVADTLIHNPTADVLPVPGDDGADAGVSPGVSAEVVDGSVIAHRGQDLLMLRANTQISFFASLERIFFFFIDFYHFHHHLLDTLHHPAQLPVLPLAHSVQPRQL